MRNHSLPHHENKTVNDRWGTKRKALYSSIASIDLGSHSFKRLDLIKTVFLAIDLCWFPVAFWAAGEFIVSAVRVDQ